MPKFVTPFLWLDGSESFASIDVEACVPYPPTIRVGYHRPPELDWHLPYCRCIDAGCLGRCHGEYCFECTLREKWGRHLRWASPALDDPARYHIYINAFYWEKGRGRWFAEAILFRADNTRWFEATADEAGRWLRENRYEVPPELAGPPDGGWPPDWILCSKSQVLAALKPTGDRGNTKLLDAMVVAGCLQMRDAAYPVGRQKSEVRLRDPGTHAKVREAIPPTTKRR